MGKKSLGSGLSICGCKSAVSIVAQNTVKCSDLSLDLVFDQGDSIKLYKGLGACSHGFKFENYCFVGLNSSLFVVFLQYYSFWDLKRFNLTLFTTIFNSYFSQSTIIFLHPYNRLKHQVNAY